MISFCPTVLAVLVSVWCSFDAAVPALVGAYVMLALYWTHQMDSSKIARYIGLAHQSNGIIENPPAELVASLRFISVVLYDAKVPFLLVIKTSCWDASGSKLFQRVFLRWSSPHTATRWMPTFGVVSRRRYAHIWCLTWYMKPLQSPPSLLTAWSSLRMHGSRFRRCMSGQCCKVLGHSQGPGSCSLVESIYPHLLAVATVLTLHTASNVMYCEAGGADHRVPSGRTRASEKAGQPVV